MISRRTYVWTALALAALLFCGLNIFADNFFTDTRLDLTQNHQYTLSDGTRAIIAKLPEPITLRFYFSKKNSADYPVTAAYAKRVRDLLGEYAALSHGKIVLEDVDPESYTPEEDQANAAGIRPAPTDNGDQVYFGIEGINSIDNKEVLPYLAVEREPYLEYDLSTLLYQLSHPDKPKLAIITALPATNAPDTNQPLAIFSELQHDYDVTTLQPNFDKIPDGTKLLLIAHPQSIGVKELRQIEIFAVHGGNVLVFVDPLSELVKEENNPDAPPSSDLIPLLKGWGVDYNPKDVVLDRGLAQSIRAGDQGQAIAYPLWLHLTQDNFSQRDPVTASLQSMNLASVGSLTQTKGATTRFEPLLTSSPQASLGDRDVVTMAMNDPASLIEQVEPRGKPFTIAARLTGKAVFPGVVTGNVNIIVMADTDIFDDRFWLNGSGANAQPFADNQGFILNAVENMSGSDDLISLRMRGNTDRPFTVVRDMQADAQVKFRETLETLQERLTASEQEIAQLQQGGNGSNTAMTPQQSSEIDRVRRDIAGTRAQLRDVQRQLRAEIDQLGTLLAFLNILLIPIVVAIFAIIYGTIRRRRAALGTKPASSARTA